MGALKGIKGCLAGHYLTYSWRIGCLQTKGIPENRGSAVFLRPISWQCLRRFCRKLSVDPKLTNCLMGSSKAKHRQIMTTGEKAHRVSRTDETYFTNVILTLNGWVAEFSKSNHANKYKQALCLVAAAQRA